MKRLMPTLPEGVRHFPLYLSPQQQASLINEIRQVVQEAPLFVPAMPRTGKEMSVRMTNCGELGWVTDKERGYRYQPTHPLTGAPWPPIPEMLLDIWRDVAGHDKPPQACLVNFYDEKARMGLHQDRDESDFPLRWCPSRWVMTAASGWVPQSAADRPLRSGWRAAMCWFWVDKAASPFMASTASTRKVPRC